MIRLLNMLNNRCGASGAKWERNGKTILCSSPSLVGWRPSVIGEAIASRVEAGLDGFWSQKRVDSRFKPLEVLILEGYCLVVGHRD